MATKKLLVTYQNKIQWRFSAFQIKAIEKMLKILGVKTLTGINIMDENYKVIHSYKNMYSNRYSERETLNSIKQFISENNNAHYVEILKK